MNEEEKKDISNAELCAMWLNDEIPLSEYMRLFKKESSSPVPETPVEA